MTRMMNCSPRRELIEPEPHCALARAFSRHGLRMGTFIGIVALLLLWVQPVAAQTVQATGPVYALPGTLSRATNRSYDTILTIQNGAQFGLVGETPEIEAEIVELRALTPPVSVKVWGDRFAQLNTDELETIVVSAIQSEQPVPTAQPTAQATEQPTAQPTAQPTVQPTVPPSLAVPVAVIEAAAVNARSGPGTNYPILGALAGGQTCAITGRNEASTWWRLSCVGTVSGWVFGDLLALAGPVAEVPVVQTAAPPTPAPATTFVNWRSAFYANRDLSGTPALLLDLPNINFNWGEGSPGANVPSDNFSARFERTMNFNFGTYEISVTMDDGARLFIDDELVIDEWQVGGSRTRTTRQVLSGSRQLRLEYFEATGAAQLQLSINFVSSGEAWQVAYFNNNFLGGNPVLRRGEPRGGNYPLDYNWGRGSPAPSVNPDDWSARWVGTFNFEGGDYRFVANVDDSVRLYIDGIRVLDEWLAGYNANVNNVFRNLGPGNHEITVEFQELAGDAILRVWWERITSGGDDNDNGGRPRDE